MKSRCLLIILMALLMVSLVLAIEDCKGVMNTGDIPCLVISSWQFPNACNTYDIKLYNQTPINIQNLTLGDYGLSGRCNATFNQTKVGSYLLNWSSGDSSKIIVEVDESMQIAISVVLSALAILFVLLGIFLFLKLRA